MTDVPAVEPTISKDAKEVIALSIIGLCIAMLLIVIGIYVYMLFEYGKAPPELADFAKICFGFLFGSLFGLASNLIQGK